MKKIRHLPVTDRSGRKTHYKVNAIGPKVLQKLIGTYYYEFYLNGYVDWDVDLVETVTK